MCIFPFINNSARSLNLLKRGVSLQRDDLLTNPETAVVRPVGVEVNDEAVCLLRDLFLRFARLGSSEWLEGGHLRHLNINSCARDYITYARIRSE